jgi:hypothetical protein
LVRSFHTCEASAPAKVKAVYKYVVACREFLNSVDGSMELLLVLRQGTRQGKLVLLAHLDIGAEVVNLFHQFQAQAHKGLGPVLWGLGPHQVS